MAEFVTELRKLSEQCQFGGCLDKMLHDQLVCGVKDRRLQWRLLAEPDLTFKKAFELCHASELAEKNVEELQAGEKQTLKMAGASVMALHSEIGDRKPASGPKCHRCNSTQHLAKDCHFKAAVCHACGKQATLQGQHSEQREGRQEALPSFGPTHASTDC